MRSLEAFDRVQPGDVLVAPMTAPAWTPLFGRVVAVVTDTGGAAAHASIIAREYGLPAVVGTTDATGRLRDGELVEVDGSAGTVRRAEIIPIDLQIEVATAAGTRERRSAATVRAASRRSGRH